MIYTTLPGTSLKVSKICLGTMTWGKQNSQSDAFGQMNYALEHGVNFFDTAELYAIPKERETQGATETIIGNWFKETGNRNKVILASKIAGPAKFNNHYIREKVYTKEAFEDALHHSLKRLQTDHIDLYQLHWPDRATNFFGQRGVTKLTETEYVDRTQEILEILNGFIKDGKIGVIGLSNETPWGTMNFLEKSRAYDLPKISTVQNPYNLLNRTYEIGMSEISLREDVGLLPYSPLGFGRLSDKFLDGSDVSSSRIELFPSMSRYNRLNALKATEAYYRLAKAHGISLAVLALAFVNTRPFVTSNIIGATTMEQLKENITSASYVPDASLLKAIEEIHEGNPNPAP
ncbi:aldo/keto reductase [Robertkochia solimangrovi]|uniref:aldo/keto reductase n=1 Tax=Robertkochia solimangrovi TaxID=2213046 RepID=UPI0011800018|nr:aldo/keto reductase [Robertkochia solimangrovi]TRZ45827.1 aldo/keto reductase [Robertkochia solimangrovi]